MGEEETIKKEEKKVKKNIKKPLKKNVKQELEEAVDGWRRARADYENLKKRSADERVELLKMANKGLVLDLLPVVDNFDAAFKSLPEGEENNWIVGFEFIKKQLDALLEEYSVKPIVSVGEQFNPLFHESAGEEVSPNSPEGSIISEQRKGYEMHGTVIRPARVIVAKAQAE